MKTLIRPFLTLVAICALLTPALAFNFNESSHIKLTYNYCERDATLRIVIYQSQGEDDQMNHFKLTFDPASGNDQTVMELFHIGQNPAGSGWDTLTILKSNHPGKNMEDGMEKFLYKFTNGPTFNFNPQFIKYEQLDEDGFYLFWFEVKLNQLPPGTSSNFIATGFWNNSGSNGENVNIDKNLNLNVVAPLQPNLPLASQDSCGKVLLSWTGNETTNCPATEKWIIKRDNVNYDTINVNWNLGTHTWVDSPLAPGVMHSYAVQFWVENGHASGFTPPVVGKTHAAPMNISNPGITVLDCEGNLTINWVNGSIYEDIQIESNYTIPGIPPVLVLLPTEFIEGNLTSWSTTLTEGNASYNFTVRGVDKCGVMTQVLNFTNIKKPSKPAAFNLTQVDTSQGTVLLGWTASTDAEDYTILRKEGSNPAQEIGTTSGTSFVDNQLGTCTVYSYRIRANNDCGTTFSGSFIEADVIEPADSGLENGGMIGSKGYYPNRVELSWDPPATLTFDHYKLFRQRLDPPGSADQFLDDVSKNAQSYVDEFAQAGVLYRYSLKAFSECNGNASLSTGVADIGFRLPVANVNGNVKFESGQGVPDVQVMVERNEGNIGRSIKFSGNGNLIFHPTYEADAAGLQPSDSMTVEIWVRPADLQHDFQIFHWKQGGASYGLFYDHSEAQVMHYYNFGGVSSTRAHNVELSTGGFTHLALVVAGNDIKLYEDGEERQDLDPLIGAPTGDSKFRIGHNMNGYIDEVRVWTISKTAEEIIRDFSRFIDAEAEGLHAYWHIDEGLGDGVYDISGQNENFHANHLRLTGDAAWSTVIPQSSELGYLSYTDSVGNYTIKNIRYTAQGNTFTVNPFYSPGGTPHQFEPASKVLFLGEGAIVQNGVDFTDISSFKARANVFYNLTGGETCKNEKVFILIDDQIAQQNGEPVKYDPTPGVENYAFNIPIGYHRIKVQQAGHNFVDGGTWPPPNQPPFDFQEDPQPFTFYDSTRVRVVGRVAGGTREGDKKPAFGKSKNNIGMADITFTTLNGCHTVNVRTDSLTGEYSVDLLPFKYNVEVDMVSPLLPDDFFEEQDQLDLSIVQPPNLAFDTLYNPNGQIQDIDTAFFNIRRDFIFRSGAELDVVDTDSGGPLMGEQFYNFLLPEQDDTVRIPLNFLPYPVFYSGVSYETRISAFESYMNFDAPDTILLDRVPITDGKLKIVNGLGNAGGYGQDFEEIINFSDPDGDTLYVFLGGLPELSNENNSPDEEFTKTFQITLEIAGQPSTNWMPNGDFYRGYVLGGKPIEGSSFITEGPETVDYILRDPPGGSSFATFKEGETFTTSNSWFASTTGSFETKTKLLAGSSWFVGGGVAGIGFATTLWNDQGVKINLSTKIDVNGNYEETTTTTSSISTSSKSNLTGAPMDIFIGKSRNYLFGASEELTIVKEEFCGPEVNCADAVIQIDGQNYRLATRSGVFVVPQGFKTSFIYSQFFIETEVIPNLEKARNQIFMDSSNYVPHLPTDHPLYGVNNDDPRLEDFSGLTPSTDNPEKTTTDDFDGDIYTYTPAQGAKPDDRIRWHNQQIRLWKEALARNEKLKVKADLKKNISFDGGTSFTYEESSANTNSHTESFELAVKTSSEFFLGTIIAGSGGKFAFTLGLDVVVGAKFTQTDTDFNSYSYTLADNNTGDFFSVDVMGDGHGNGPVFKLRGGESMCPWERGGETKYYEPLGQPLSESTIRREWPEIDVEPNEAINVPEHQSAVFRLKLRNESPTDDIQWYGLRVIDETLPGGVKLSIDGASPNRVFEIPPKETVEKQLLVSKLNPSSPVNEFDSIKLVFYSTCEYDAFQDEGVLVSADTITISAKFIPTCSPVSVDQPGDPWVLNVNGDNLINIKVSGYDQSYQGFENYQLQYKPTFSAEWKGVQTFYSSSSSSQEGIELDQGATSNIFNWDVTELNDGPYNIRAVSRCQNNLRYESPPVTGIIDRLRPHPFGNPQPADGVLDPNDELLIQFNETINSSIIQKENFSVKAVLNGTAIRHNTSALLDGTNDYIEMAPGTRVSGYPFTVEMWVKRGSTGSAVLWSQGDDVDSSMVIGFNSANQLYFRLDETTITSDSSITTTEQWIHLAVSCNEVGTVNFYITGVPQEGGAISDLVAIPGKMTFGKRSWEDSGYFHGNLHELRIWRAEQSLGMIQIKMLETLAGTEPGLSALWPVDEGTGTELRDIVRKKHATLNGTWDVLPEGYAAIFDGDARMDVNFGQLVFSHQHSFTLEFWMKAAADETDAMTVLSSGKGDGTDGHEPGWAITVNGAGQLQVHHGGKAPVVISKNVRDDNWHHIALVMNRTGNLNTYLDGLLQSSEIGSNFGEFSGAVLYIAARGWPTPQGAMQDQYFTGSLDEIRVWNMVRRADQIRIDMQHRLEGNEAGLAFYLPFEAFSDGSGMNQFEPEATDQGPDDLEVTLINDPLLTDADPNLKLPRPLQDIDFSYSVNNDKILFTILEDPVRVENVNVEVTVMQIEDLNGNEMAGPVSWNAYINKNQLQWGESELVLEKPEKEPMSFEVAIKNSGGIELSFEILNLPDWLSVTPAFGTIGPVSEKPIKFTISPGVAIGDYVADINLLSGQGFNDKLIIDLHVFGVAPKWTFDPADYEYSMSIVADLEIFGELSADTLDRVAAFINGEVRGLATMQYIPAFDRYLAFLDVYSNIEDGEDVSFKAWDGSTGETFAGLLFQSNIQPVAEQTVEFESDMLHGTPEAPARLSINTDKIQYIPLNEGWTWISFNVLSSAFNDLDLFFSELILGNGDLVKSQTKESSYNPSSGWGGNMASIGLEIEKMYKVNFSNADILQVVGPRVDPELYPIPVQLGWNWIPFLSSEPIEINEAMSSFNASNGDQVKSQDQFAVYHAIQGWQGTLKTLVPGKGYMLYAYTPGQITFPLEALKPAGPVNPFESLDAEVSNIIFRSGGTMKPVRYRKSNMTVLARLVAGDQSIEGLRIAAFMDGQLLDIQSGMEVAGSADDLYFLTLQGNGETGYLHFEVYDQLGNFVGIAEEKPGWAPNSTMGSLEDPMPLHLRKVGEPDFSAFPNPFTDQVNLLIETPEACQVQIEIFDSRAVLIESMKFQLDRGGKHLLSLEGPDLNWGKLAPGAYFLRMTNGDFAGQTMLIRQ